MSRFINATSQKLEVKDAGGNVEYGPFLPGTVEKGPFYSMQSAPIFNRWLKEGKIKEVP